MIYYRKVKELIMSILTDKSKYKKRIIDKVGTDKIQLVTISRPSAYGEYEPYHFCDTEDEFERTVAKM